MFKLVQISDTHFSAAEGLANTGWEDLAAAIGRARPDLVVHSGDIVRDCPGDPADHAFARARLAELKAKWLALPGNHDVGDGPPAAASISPELVTAFDGLYGQSHWIREAEDWRLIGVNSMLLGTSLPAESAEWDFLERGLREAGDKERAVFIHKPIFVLDPGEAQAGSATMPPSARVRFWNLMLRHHVRLVASGHRHEYRALQRDGISLVWAPAASTTELGERTLPFGPEGTTAGFIEFAFCGRTSAHRLVSIGAGRRKAPPVPGVDLRSDVLALPSPAVLTAIEEAGQAPLGFSRHEDPHQQRLTAMLCDAFAFEDGLFLPTGSMANQIALRLSCSPGEAILAEAESHVAVNEAPSVAGLNGVVVRSVPGERGHLRPEVVELSLREPPASAPERRLRLVWLENTHNRAGGTVMPPGWLAPIVSTCSRAGIPIHIDGARIFDAVHASGVPTREIASGAASLTICLNKGPGAPHGAMLLGSRDFMRKAEAVQKMFGGLWRPAGLLAAAAVAAFETWQTRVGNAHERARELAAALAPRLPEGISVVPPQTNIVMLDLGSEDAVSRLLPELTKLGVRASNYRRGRIRLVTHASISKADVVDAVSAICLALGMIDPPGRDGRAM